MKFYRILHYLINNSYKKITQKKISEACSCTQAYVSKITKKLTNKKIILRAAKNSIMVQNPLMLAYLLSYEKQLPTPLTYKTTSTEDVLETFKKTTYSLTLESAKLVKEHRVPGRIWAHVLGKDIQVIHDSFNQTFRKPDLIIFPADIFKFQTQNLINNTYTVSDWDLIIDYLTIGDNGEAVRLLKKYKLCEL